MTFEDLSHQLYTNAHARVPFPLTHEEIAAVVNGPFMAFLQLPEKNKGAYYYKMPMDFRGGDVGYFHRSPSHDGDEKHLVHYHPSAESVFEDAYTECPEFQALMQSMRRLYTAAHETFQGTLALFKRDFPHIMDSFFLSQEHPHLFVRINAYMGSYRLAKNHMDMSGCSLGIAENAPGLRIGWTEEDMTDVILAEQEAVFFPGLTFLEETSKQYPPAWHGVEQRKRPNYLTRGRTVDALQSQEIARWSVVAFLSGSKIRNPTMQETNKPHPLSMMRANEIKEQHRLEGQMTGNHSAVIQ